MGALVCAAICMCMPIGTSSGNFLWGSKMGMENTEESMARGRAGKTTLISKNITVLGRRTSVRLEPEMWVALKDIARRERCRIHDICSLIERRKQPDTSLTAAIRVFLMLYYRAAATEEGHMKAGHGNFQVMLRRARVGAEEKKPAFMRVLQENCGKAMAS